MSLRPVSIINTFFSFLILFGISTFTSANTNQFHSPYFDITLLDNLKLISKTEDATHGFYRYVFGSSNGDDAEMQMRVIVSTKAPDVGQSIESFQTDAVANMSVMYMDAYKLYQYINTPENKKVLAEKPSQLKFGDNNFAGMTLYFGNINASFFVSNPNNMTYAFTLISNNADTAIRENHLKLLTDQLRTITFNRVGG